MNKKCSLNNAASWLVLVLPLRVKVSRDANYLFPSSAVGLKFLHSAQTDWSIKKGDWRHFVLIKIAFTCSPHLPPPLVDDYLNFLFAPLSSSQLGPGLICIRLISTSVCFIASPPSVTVSSGSSATIPPACSQSQDGSCHLKAVAPICTRNLEILNICLSLRMKPFCSNECISS